MISQSTTGNTCRARFVPRTAVNKSMEALYSNRGLCFSKSSNSCMGDSSCENLTLDHQAKCNLNAAEDANTHRKNIIRQKCTVGSETKQRCNTASLPRTSNISTNTSHYGVSAFQFSQAQTTLGPLEISVAQHQGPCREPTPGPRLLRSPQIHGGHSLLPGFCWEVRCCPHHRSAPKSACSNTQSPGNQDF